MKMTRLFFPLLAMALAGCPSDESSICGNGDEVTVDGEGYCVYRYSVVVENGFECPPERPNLFQEGGIGICAEQQMLPEMQIERIGREYREISPGYTACVLDFDCDTGEVCRAGACQMLDANNTNNTNAQTNNTNGGTNNTNGGTNNVPGCQSSADCQAGEVCENAVCLGACGGFAGFTCDPTEFCDFADGDMCGAADALGTCRPRPDVCTDDVMPVCGCDAQDYTNECEANAAGTDAASDGACM